MSLSNLTINFQTQHLSFQMLNILERQTLKVTAIIAIVCKQFLGKKTPNWIVAGNWVKCQQNDLQGKQEMFFFHLWYP